MKMSQLYLSTLREVPAEAEIASHQLMLRAGLIHKVAMGIYSYMPLGWRTIKKIMDIIRQEMDAKGGQELCMPIVQPAELWQDSGRWWVYGQELMRMKDRHGRDFLLGPTHEEVITAHPVSYTHLVLWLKQSNIKTFWLKLMWLKCPPILPLSWMATGGGQHQEIYRVQPAIAPVQRPCAARWRFAAKLSCRC